MIPERDREARRFQLTKLKARITAAGLLDKLDARKPLTLAFYFGEKAAFALRWRRQSREPHHIIEALEIDTQDVARVIGRLATNDLRTGVSELVEALAELVSRGGGGQSARSPNWRAHITSG